jgi:hypothetical protein
MAKYMMDIVALTESVEERDLGVILTSNLKASSHCQAICKKANRALGMIRRTFNTRRQDILLRVYKALVRPHLEFCTPAWSPLYKKDAQLLEKVQHRFTRLIPELKSLPYSDRLSRLGITTLEERRNRADLLEMFKMYRQLSSIPFNRFFQLDSEHKTRGHSAKVSKQRCLTTVRQHFFSDRVVNRWNMLTDDIVSSSSLNQFKSKLQQFCRLKKGFLLDWESANPAGWIR